MVKEPLEIQSDLKMVIFHPFLKHFKVPLIPNQLINKVMAAASLANIVKSSLGPLGLDKMLVDDIGVRHSLTSHHTQTFYLN